MPVLTIAIPTYNRLGWLQKSLAAVVVQVRACVLDDVEVFVSDNASDDGTWEYLLSEAQQHPFLRVHRNAQNIGGEANFYQLPQFARGQYLYMIGDDDVLESGTVTRILHEIENKPDYLVLNFDTYDPSLQSLAVANNLHVTEDRTFASADECLSVVNAMQMGFISMWVARKEFFNRIPEDMFRHFSQWGMSIQADRYFGISQYPKGRLLAHCCFRNRQDGDFSHNYFEWFLHGGVQTLRYAVAHNVVSPETAARLKRHLLINSGLGRIRYERRIGIFDQFGTYRLLRGDFGNMPSFWFLCVPLIYMPFLGCVVKIGRWLLGRKS